MDAPVSFSFLFPPSCHNPSTVWKHAGRFIFFTSTLNQKNTKMLQFLRSYVINSWLAAGTLGKTEQQQKRKKLFWKNKGTFFVNTFKSWKGSRKKPLSFNPIPALPASRALLCSSLQQMSFKLQSFSRAWVLHVKKANFWDFAKKAMNEVLQDVPV